MEQLAKKERRGGRTVLVLVLVWILGLSQPGPARSGETGWSRQNLTPAENAWLSHHPRFRLGVGTKYVPIMFTEEADGGPVFKGMVADYLRLLENRLGVKLEVSWDASFQKTLDRGRAGKLDVFPCVAETPARKDFLTYTRPYLSFPFVILTRTDFPVITGFRDLVGRKVAVIRKLAAYGRLKRDYPGLTFHFVNSFPEALKAVSTGQADAYLMNIVVATYYLNHLGLTNLKVAGPAPYPSNDLAMAVRKDWPELVGILNKVLDSISPEEHSAIRERWIRVDLKYGVDWATIRLYGLLSLLAVVLIVGSIIFWNRKLRLEIISRERAQKELAESRRLFQTVFRANPGAISLSEFEDGRYILVNDGFRVMYGHSPEEAIGRTPGDLGIWGDDPEQGRERNRILLEKGGVYNFEYEFMRRDGSRGTALNSAELIEFDGQQRIVSISQDISERIAGEMDRANLEIQLRHSQKMEAVGTLAGGIAHDFNNILQVIRGYLELLTGFRESPRASVELIPKITEAVDRAADLVQGLLTFSRRVDPVMTIVDLNRAVAKVADMLGQILPRMITVETELAASRALIRVDEGQLSQVILNLGSNAGDAMPEGGRLIFKTARVSAAKVGQAVHDVGITGNFVNLSVTDSGVGMDEDTQARVFDPFFTTKEQGRGTGLGLATVYGIMESHGGYITCRSRIGRGATFDLFWPEVGEGQEVKTGPEAKPDLSGTGSGTLLVVDDEPSILYVARRALESRGYRVLTVESGEEALAAYHREGSGIDLVVLDLGMPGLGGKRTITELRRLASNIKILVCSGYLGPDGGPEIVAHGADRVLAKPYQIDELLATVEALLKDPPKSGPESSDQG